MKEYKQVKKFELLPDTAANYQRGAKAAQIALDLGKTAMMFSRVERVPRYADGERENNAEHSYMLQLVVPEVIAALELPLDKGLAAQLAGVHDLIELLTGDVATFLFDEAAQTNKEANEHSSLNELLAMLPPHTANLLARYEAQAEPEARFVRYIDKLLPVVVDIIGAGKKVMAEDYGISSLEALQLCHEKLHIRLVSMFNSEFPEIDIAHKLLCELFETTFDTEL